MAAIKTTFGEALKGIAEPDHDGVQLAAALRAITDDNTALRTAIIALLVKLDADTGLDDSDYESTLTPAALTHTKG